MYAAIDAHVDVPREIFRTKAKAMGRSGIWFFEREAPLPVEDTSLWTFPDHRTLRAKFGPIYAKDDPFPRERYGGQGYNRKAEVDLERVSVPSE